MSESTLCNAIKSEKLVQFYYTGDDVPGYRIVEPHMVAYNERNNLALSAWYLRGASESGTGQGWREYLLSEMTSITVLDEEFAGSRPGYNPTGGKKFHNVRCAL